MYATKDLLQQFVTPVKRGRRIIDHPPFCFLAKVLYIQEPPTDRDKEKEFEVREIQVKSPSYVVRVEQLLLEMFGKKALL